MTDDELQELERRGALGNLCELLHRIAVEQCLQIPEPIGIPLEQLKAVGNVMGAAGGRRETPRA